MKNPDSRPVRLVTLAAALLAGAGAVSVHAAQGALLLVGGGAEGADGDTASWSWAPYRWFVEQSLAGGPNGGNGRIAIIDTEPYPQCDEVDRGYCAYFESLGAVEAQAMHVSRRCLGAEGCLRADDPATFEAIRAFDGVWFRGGDQSLYVDAWGDSELERGLGSIHAAGGVLGGTSAGAMILSPYTSSGDATSYEATSDPFHPRIAFDETLLGREDALTPALLVDTHFTTRARLGRLAVFLARLERDTGQRILGAGIDEHTALAVDGDGVARVYGEGAVSFMQLTAAAEEDVLLAPQQPPYLRDVRLDQLTAGFAYDLAARQIVTISPDARPADPVPPAPAFRRAVISGSSAAASRLGQRWAFWRTEDDLYTGNLLAAPGRGALGRGAITTLLEDETPLREVRTGGPQWLLAGPLQHGLALYLDGFDGEAFNRVLVQEDGAVRALPAPASPEQSVVIVDCYDMQWVAGSTADPDGNGLPRQSVALSPCAMHLLNSQLGPAVYDALNHAPRE